MTLAAACAISLTMLESRSLYVSATLPQVRATMMSARRVVSHAMLISVCLALGFVCSGVFDGIVVCESLICLAPRARVPRVCDCRCLYRVYAIAQVFGAYS